MEKLSGSDIEQRIVAVLEKQKRDFLTIAGIRNHLPVALLRSLGLSGKKARTPDVVKALEPFIGGRLQVYRSGRIPCIGFCITPDAMILKRTGEKPGLSSRQLFQSLPLVRRDALACLNRLLETGALKCRLDEKHTIRLYLPPAGIPEIIPEPDVRSAFANACERSGRGRRFIRIHRVRELLGWPVEKFDRVLEKLMADYTIELHGGDPSRLTDQEIRDSYTDASGTLYITLTWWGKDK